MTNTETFDGGRYTIAQLASILNVPRQRVRAWFVAGLIKPAAEINGVCYFDFQCVACAKTLSDLANAGLNARQIQQRIEQLRSRFDGAALEQLAILEKNGQLLVRLESGLVDSAGQGYLDFDEECAIVDLQPVSATEWFELGYQHEADGALDEAIHAYRQALMTGGPNVDASFNLANALAATGRTAEASERYLQAIELNPEFAEAWNNLGVVLGESRQFDAAESALRKAIRLGYGDAEFNLARVLEHAGRTGDAREHWAAFAKTAPSGDQKSFALARLAK